MSPQFNARAAVWIFYTNHTHVLFCLAEELVTCRRDIAVRVGLQT